MITEKPFLDQAIGILLGVLFIFIAAMLVVHLLVNPFLSIIEPHYGAAHASGEIVACLASPDPLEGWKEECIEYETITHGVHLIRVGGNDIVLTEKILNSWNETICTKKILVKQTRRGGDNDGSSN